MTQLYPAPQVTGDAESPRIKPHVPTALLKTSSCASGAGVIVLAGAIVGDVGGISLARASPARSKNKTPNFGNIATGDERCDT